MRSAKKCVNVLLASLMAGLGSGCKTVEDVSLTYQLWDSGGHNYCRPQANPELALSEVASQNDILVEYNAFNPRHDRVRRLAYFLIANQARINEEQPPHFIDPKKYHDTTNIPVVSQKSITAGKVPANCYATVAAGGRSFTMFYPGQKPEFYKLPKYKDDPIPFGKVALTPVALAEDATLLGLVVAIIGGLMWVQGGGPGVAGR